MNPYRRPKTPEPCGCGRKPSHMPATCPLVLALPSATLGTALAADAGYVAHLIAESLTR